jgi:polyphosphate kinase 2 (PPK2 family)
MIARLDDPHKHYKIGLEDFRNIAKREQYIEAYNDMLERTDTDHAPWNVIASNNKMRARLKGLKIVEEIVGKGIDDLVQPLDPRITKAAHELWGWKPGEKKNNKHH